MNSFVVLLRGVNVGGKNRIPMAELKGYLEELGCKHVQTYIQSGNVIVQSDLSLAKLGTNIEKMLSEKFVLDSAIIKVLVLSKSQLEAIVSNKPRGFGEQPEKYHSDVIFMIGVDVAEALKVFSPRDGVDRVWPGNGVIYSERLSEQRTKSRLGKIVGTPAYHSMTIRNWNTTTKLLSLMQTYQ